MATATTELTTKQQRVLELVNEVGPSPKALAARLGITRNGAAVHLRNLRKLGVIPPPQRRRRRQSPGDVARRRKPARRPSSNGHGRDARLDDLEREQPIRHAFGASADHERALDEGRATYKEALQKRRDALQDAAEFHRDQSRQHEDEAQKNESLLGRVEHELEALATS